jgi:tetratricopeptide (TPR) repeat protein
MCGLIVFIALVAGAPVFGQSPDWDRCKDVNNADTADRALAACNRILNNRAEAKNYAMALRNRCGIWYTKSDYDHALADCNQAIRMEPRSAIAYNRRGLIWHAKDNEDPAIADFDQAIGIDPNFAFAFFNRALAWRAKGDNGRADADKAKAIRLDPKLAE